MCVIMLVSNTRPTEEMIRRAWDANKDGAGIAWREKDWVVWEKGIMQIDRAIELCAKAPLPYVAHFRVASIGGVKPALTHPFLVGAEASVELKGKTKGSVLFHNGHWNMWNDKMLDAAIHSNSRLPDGSDWSDSRAMAWLVHIYGPTLMELLLSQKGVLMSPKKFNVFTGNGWEKINDVWCSNDFFWAGRRHHGGHTTMYGRLCSIGRCTEKAQAGKDICVKCEESRAAAAKTIASAASQTQETKAFPIATGGAERTGPLAKMFSMPEVESFHRAGHISKSILKKYRKAHGNSLQKEHRGLRALTQMRRLSEEISERLMTVAGSAN